MSNIDELRRLALDGDLAAMQAIVIRLEEAENENAKLRIAIAEKVTSETTLRDLSVGNGSINATFEGGAIQLMVDALATQFVESGASNYIEMQFHSEATGPLLFTLQRVNGKTPHQLRAEAEKERAELAEKLAAANRAVDEAYQRGYATGQEEIEAERDELRAKIETVEKNLRCCQAEREEAAALFLSIKTRLTEERDALRAKIAEMEKQRPVAWAATDETRTVVEALGMNQSRRFDSPLFLAAGAQPAPSAPDKVEVREDKEGEIFSRGSYNEGYDNGWNDCIDAILTVAPEAKP